MFLRSTAHADSLHAATTLQHYDSRSKCPDRITVHRKTRLNKNTSEQQIMAVQYISTVITPTSLQQLGHFGFLRQQQTIFVPLPHLRPLPLPDQVSHHPLIAPGNAQGAHLHSTAQTA